MPSGLEDWPNRRIVTQFVGRWAPEDRWVMSPNEPTLPHEKTEEPSVRAEDEAARNPETLTEERPAHEPFPEEQPPGVPSSSAALDEQHSDPPENLGSEPEAGPHPPSGDPSPSDVTSDQDAPPATPPTETGGASTESTSQIVATTTPPTVIATTEQAPPTESSEQHQAPAVPPPSAITPQPSPVGTPEPHGEPAPADAEPPHQSPEQPTAPQETTAQGAATSLEATGPEIAPAGAASSSPDSSAEAKAEQPEEATPESPRPRVTLDRSATEEQGKPQPSLPLEGDGGVAGANQPNKPRGPVRGVEIPSSAELDPAMEQELEAALSSPPPEEAPTADAGIAGSAPPTPAEMDSLEPGMKLTGTIQLVGEETVFVDLGLRSPGMIQRRQFPEGKTPETGQSIEVIVDRVDVNSGTLVVGLPRAPRKPAGNWDALAKGQVVDVIVNKTNKGGLEVTVSNLRGFMPASQVDLGFVEDLESYVGQKLTCVVTEVNPKKRNLVLSRRKHLQQERREQEKELWESLAVGQQRTGRVKTIKDYGAFIDLGGIDGFLHVGEISWNRIDHPRDILSPGQDVDVSILKVDRDSRKIGLGMKQLQTNPWSAAAEKYPTGSTISGKVTRTAGFGAFVAVEEGIEGLIHISELEHRRVGHVTEVVNVGDSVDVKVLSVEPKRKRMSLSLKALQEKPEAPTPAEPEQPPIERKRKHPLRGGREAPPEGGQTAAGLFGNPDDYR